MFKAVANFRDAILTNCGLNLRLSKCLVYTHSGVLPPEAPECMERAGCWDDHGNWLPGLRVYGVYVGSTDYVRFKLKMEATKICSEIDKVMHLLRNDLQSAWVILSSALVHQLDYTLTLQYPSDSLECAELVDNRIWKALEQLAGQPQIARGGEAGGANCVLDLSSVPSLNGRSFQSLLSAQPIKLGGIGIRSLSETRFPAFVGGLEQALPHMVAGDLCESPLAPSLQPVIGNLTGQNRWSDFLAANSRAAQEFAEAWNSLSEEAANIWTFLGEEPSGLLADPVTSVGGASTDGSTRTKAVQQREALRHKLLERALSIHPARDARPVTAFQNIADDKCAGSWLLALPGRENNLSCSVFKEALSTHLCLPSPAIRAGGWVGKPVGSKGQTVDKYGDSVLCCHEIPGDGWRVRHDTVKQAIFQEACLSKIPVNCEIYGLFGDLLPASLTEVGGELQWGRARQGKVPDLKLLLPTPEGPQDSLAELKVVNAAVKWYPRGVKGKGTDRRAVRLNQEYEAKLRALDARFHGMAPGGTDDAIGPLVKRFRELGSLGLSLVAGPFGDLSSDFHRLIQIFAESRAASISRSQGFDGGDGLLGRVTGQIRRVFSTTIVRANAKCLLDRLAQLGNGAASAAKRRQISLDLEYRRRQEAEAVALAWASRGCSRLGRAYV